MAINPKVGPTRGVYVISVAAELAGVHPQTLRIYERRGLLDPARTAGGNRRYSERDLDRLHRIAELTEYGLNLAGVKRVLELEAEVGALKAEVAALEAQLERVRTDAKADVDAAERRHRRDLVPLSQSVVLRGRWFDPPRPDRSSS
jgi:MerR family transcriptional regulator/heat shock protein HspR